MDKTVSILGCGRVGMLLVERLARKYPKVKASTTSKDKIQEIKNVGGLPYLINSHDLDFNSYVKFLDTDVLIISLPPQSVRVYQILADDIAKAGIKKVLFISSTAVYPKINREVTEVDAEYIKSPHSGRVMLSLEDVFAGRSEFETTVIRFCGIVDPREVPGKHMFGFSGLKDGKRPVNMIHIEDCAGMIEKILEKEAWGKTYNACADRHPSRSEFYVKAARSAGSKPPEFENETPAEGSFRIVDSSKLKQELDYKLKHPDPTKIFE